MKDTMKLYTCSTVWSLLIAVYMAVSYYHAWPSYNPGPAEDVPVSLQKTHHAARAAGPMLPHVLNPAGRTTVMADHVQTPPGKECIAGRTDRRCCSSTQPRQPTQPAARTIPCQAAKIHP